MSKKLNDYQIGEGQAPHDGPANTMAERAQSRMVIFVDLLNTDTAPTQLARPFLSVGKHHLIPKAEQVNSSGFIFKVGLNSNPSSSNIQLCDLGKPSSPLSPQVPKTK